MSDTTSKSDLPESPFPGIPPFSYGDRSIFFAREAEIRTLVRLIVMYRGVLLYADSGIGKSSLINAGLVDQGIKEGYQPERIRVQPRKGEEIIVERFVETSNGASHLLPSIFAEEGQSEHTVLSVEQFLTTLHDKAGVGHPLLIFDQFEEWVTLFEEGASRQTAEEARASQEKILEAIVSLINDSALPVKVLIALREDYLAKLTPFFTRCPSLPDQYLRLTALHGEQISRVIRHPFEQYPGQYQPEISADLTTTLQTQFTSRSGGVDVRLTEVQIVCRSLWETGKTHGKDPDQIFTEQEGVQGILEQYLEDALASLGEKRREPAIGLLSRMVTSAGTRNVISHDDLISRVELEDQIPRAVLNQTLDDLEHNTKLVRRERRREVYYYEIASEFLIEWIRQQAQERQQRAEQKKRERAEHEAVERAKTAKRLRMVSLALCIMLLLAAGVAWYAWGQKAKANAASLEATEQHNRADSERENAQKRAQIAAWREEVATSISNLEIDPRLSILQALHVALRVAQARMVVEERVVHEVAEALSRAVSASRMRLTLPTKAKEGPRIAYNHDGTRLATKGRENTVMIWDVGTGQHWRTLGRHTEFVSAVAFASQGNRLATASRDNTVLVWDIASDNKEPFKLLKHDAPVVSVAFSANGKLLATADDKGILRLWNVTTGRKAKWLKGCKHEWVTDLSLSPDGKYLASASQDMTVRVWTVSMSTCKERFDRLQHDDEVQRVQFSRDGKLLATASMDRSAKIWNANNGKELRTLFGHTNTVFDVAFSPDGKRIATASADTTVRLYDTNTGRHLSTLTGDRNPIERVAFSPDQRYVATASWDGTVKVWDVNGLTDLIHTAVFSGDGRRLATAGSDGTALVWDADTGEALSYRPIPKITTMALSHHGDRVATGAKDDKVILWDVGSKKSIRRFAFAHIEQVTCIAFNRNGNRLAAGSKKGSVILWDAETGRKLPLEMDSEYGITSLAFSMNGSQLATGDENGMVRVWDTTTEESRELPDKHEKKVFNIAFSPDMKHLASASADNTARLWDFTSKDGAPRKLPHENLVMDVRFSPHGTHLITVSADRIVKVWDIASAGSEPLHTLRGHDSVVETVAFNRDGSRLATASWDRTARVWEWDKDAASWKEPLVLTHSHEVKGIGFSAEDTHLTTVSADGKVRVHFFDIERLKKFAITRVIRTMTDKECAEYLGQTPCPQ